jgi:alpha-galactosidase
MINSFLGRMHLASHLEKLSERQLNLVKDGVDYYNSLTPAKKKGLPKFPIGFNSFTKDFIVAGFETDEKLYLAVWNMGEELHREIPLKNYKTAVCAYPKANTLKYEYNNDTLTIEFTEKYQARFFELEK